MSHFHSAGGKQQSSELHCPGPQSPLRVTRVARHKTQQPTLGHDVCCIVSGPPSFLPGYELQLGPRQVGKHSSNHFCSTSKFNTCNSQSKPEDQPGARLPWDRVGGASERAATARVDSGRPKEAAVACRHNPTGLNESVDRMRKSGNPGCEGTGPVLFAHPARRLGGVIPGHRLAGPNCSD